MSAKLCALASTRAGSPAVMLKLARRVLLRLGSATQVWMPNSAVRRLGAPRRRPLGMGDAAPRGHPVDVAGTDIWTLPRLSRCMDLAVEEIGDRREPDMRMRAHIDPLPGRNSAGPI